MKKEEKFRLISRLSDFVTSGARLEAPGDLKRRAVHLAGLKPSLGDFWSINNRMNILDIIKQSGNFQALAQ